MPISIDNLLGDLPRNLQLYSKRSEVLASNLANADTPGYKAKDIDFRSALGAAGGQNLEMKTTNAGHLGGPTSTEGLNQELLYRVPVQPSLDGNTVDSQIEQGEFTQNAMRYQSTLTFLNGRFQGLKLAIKGQ